MIVGWQLATHLRTELVMDALEMANGLRRLVLHLPHAWPWRSELLQAFERLRALPAA